MNGDVAMERTQSKMDDALVQLDERLENLGTVVTVLEKRIQFVMNDYPRPSQDEAMKKPEESPSGDSVLLARMYEYSMKLRNQEGRIRILVDRLDI